MRHSIALFVLLSCTVANASDSSASLEQKAVHHLGQHDPSSRSDALSIPASSKQLASPKSVDVSRDESSAIGASGPYPVTHSSEKAVSSGALEEPESNNNEWLRFIAVGIVTALLLTTAALGVVTTMRQIRRRHHRRLL